AEDGGGDRGGARVCVGRAAEADADTVRADPAGGAARTEAMAGAGVRDAVPTAPAGRAVHAVQQPHPAAAGGRADDQAAAELDRRGAGGAVGAAETPAAGPSDRVGAGGRPGDGGVPGAGPLQVADGGLRKAKFSKGAFMPVDVWFPVKGQTLPTDHCYLLYSALSHVVPAFHKGTVRLRFSSINGERGGKGLIQLVEHSRLRLRLPAEQIGLVLPLAGRPLPVGDHRIHLGIPT